MGNRFSTAFLQRLGYRFSSRLLSLAAATVAAVLMPAGASAITLSVPDPFYSVNLHQNVGPFNAPFSAPGTYTLGLQMATIIPSPDALVSAHAEGASGIGEAPGGGYGGGGGAELIYFFLVLGRQDVIVPLFINFSLHTFVSGPSDASNVADASITARAANTIPIFHQSVAAGGIRPPGFIVPDLTATLPFAAVSGVCGTGFTGCFGKYGGNVQIDASASAFLAGNVSEAFADPFIFIDPVFLASNPDFSLIFSAGIDNVAPAAPGVPALPEPATLALFVSGLLGFVALRRRRT